MHAFNKSTFADYERALKRLREQKIAAGKSVERIRADLAEAEKGVADLDAAIADGEQIVAYMTLVNLQAAGADNVNTEAEVAAR